MYHFYYPTIYAVSLLLRVAETLTCLHTIAMMSTPQYSCQQLHLCFTPVLGKMYSPEKLIQATGGLLAATSYDGIDSFCSSILE